MRGEQVKRVVLLARAARRVASGCWFRAFEPDASSFLRTKDAQRLALDVTAMRQRDHDLFLWDKVFGRELRSLVLGDLGAAVVAVLLSEVVHLILDQQPDLLVARKDGLEVGDGLDGLMVHGVARAALDL